jgi:hypothetical protein
MFQSLPFKRRVLIESASTICGLLASFGLKVESRNAIKLPRIVPSSHLLVVQIPGLERRLRKVQTVDGLRAAVDCLLSFSTKPSLFWNVQHWPILMMTLQPFLCLLRSLHSLRPRQIRP